MILPTQLCYTLLCIVYVINCAHWCPRIPLRVWSVRRAGGHRDGYPGRVAAAPEAARALHPWPDVILFHGRPRNHNLRMYMIHSLFV